MEPAKLRNFKWMHHILCKIMQSPWKASYIALLKNCTRNIFWIWCHKNSFWLIPIYGGLDFWSRCPVFKKHWVASRSIQPFTLPWSIKWVSGTPDELAVKSKICPCGGSRALRQVNLIHKKRQHKDLKFFLKQFYTWFVHCSSQWLLANVVLAQRLFALIPGKIKNHQIV